MCHENLPGYEFLMCRVTSVYLLASNMNAKYRKQFKASPTLKFPPHIIRLHSQKRNSLNNISLNFTKL